MKNKVLTLMAVAIMALSLSGCGSKEHETLESYYSAENIQSSLEEKLDVTRESYEGYYSDVNITVTDNTMEYSYVFEEAQYINQDAMQQELENSAYKLIENLRKRTEINEELTIRYVFYNPDRSIVADVSYTN